MEELLKWLLQVLERLWHGCWVRRTRWALRVIFRVIAAILILWKIALLLSGQINWFEFLDDLTTNLIASLIFG